MNDKLTFCLTMSTGIPRHQLLAILSAYQATVDKQRFTDFDWKAHKPGQTGMLNVFEVDGRLVTLECNGLMGVTHRVVKHILNLQGDFHYVATNSGDQFVEIKNGVEMANFGPGLDETPAYLVPFFEGKTSREGAIAAMESAMGIKTDPAWLVRTTDTYAMDYRVDLV